MDLPSKQLCVKLSYWSLGLNVWAGNFHCMPLQLQLPKEQEAFATLGKHIIGNLYSLRLGDNMVT